MGKYHNPFYEINDLSEKAKKYHKQRTIKQLNIQIHSNNYFYDENGELRENAPASYSEWVNYIKNLIEEFINNNKDDKNGLEYIYYICHDKDKDKDGNIKPPHFHICLKFKKNKTIGQIAKELEVSRISNIQIATDIGGSIQYLTHISQSAIKQGKEVYNDDKIIFYDFSEKQNCGLSDLRAKMNNKALKSEDKEMRDLIEKHIRSSYKRLENGEFTSSDLYKEEITNELKDMIDEENHGLIHEILGERRTLIEDLISRYFKKKYNLRVREGRNLTNIYISGGGGLGKTTLAKELAFILGNDDTPHIPAVPSDTKTPDFLSLYEYQKVTILDEVKGSMFAPHEFRDIFDKHKQGIVASRNKDKVWLADYAILTSSNSVLEYCYDCLKYSKGGTSYFRREIVDKDNGDTYMISNGLNHKGINELYQNMRRIKFIIDIKKPTSEEIRINPALKDDLFINVFYFEGLEKKKLFSFIGSIRVKNDYYLNEKTKRTVAKKISEIMENKDVIFYKSCDSLEEEFASSYSKNYKEMCEEENVFYLPETLCKYFNEKFRNDCDLQENSFEKYFKEIAFIKLDFEDNFILSTEKTESEEYRKEFKENGKNVLTIR